MRGFQTQTRRAAKGFSLAETLFALALLALLASIIAGGLPAVISSYRDVMAKEHAELLCSTVTDRIVAEMRDGTEFETANNSFVSHSGTRYDGQRISITSSVTGLEHYAAVTFYKVIEGNGGNKTIQAMSGDYAPSLLLPKATYTNGLVVELSYTKQSNSAVKLTVSVKNEDSTKTYATRSTTVSCSSGL